MDLTNQIQTAGANNSPGLGLVILLARYGDIEVLPPVSIPDPTSVGALSGLATVTADVVMKAGKKFIKIQTNNETTAIVDKLVGETGSKAFESSLELAIPALNADALGFITAIKNDRCIAWVKDLEGKVRMIGSEAYPCILKDGEANSGKDRGSKKGLMLTLETVATNPAPIFTGMFKEYATISAGASTDISSTVWKL